MKSIECINFVSHNAPNILLIACVNNGCNSGTNLKLFKNTHNIYTLTHDTTNNFEWYYNLPSKHNQIIQELDQHNLQKFSISSLSFGGLLAFYLIFHLPNRVEKALIHDYYINSHHGFNAYKTPHIFLSINTSNWIIPKQCNIPVVFLLFNWKLVLKNDIKELKNIFGKHITFITFFKQHPLKFRNTRMFRFCFLTFNGFKHSSLWNKTYKNWILNNSISWYPRNMFLKLFTLIFKTKLNRKIK